MQKWLEDWDFNEIYPSVHEKLSNNVATGCLVIGFGMSFYRSVVSSWFPLKGLKWLSVFSAQWRPCS